MARRIAEIKVKQVWLDGADGREHCIKPLPLMRRAEFMDYQRQISEICQEYPEQTTQWLYDNHSLFQRLIDRSLMLYGLSAAVVSYGMLVELFFAYDGGPGLLWQLEWVEPAVSGRLLNPQTDPTHAAIATYWSYNPQLSLGQVMQELEACAWVDIVKILKQQNQVPEEEGSKPDLDEDLDLEEMATIDPREAFRRGLQEVVR